MLVIVNQHLSQIGRADGPIEHLSQILTAMSLESGTSQSKSGTSVNLSLAQIGQHFHVSHVATRDLTFGGVS